MPPWLTPFLGFLGPILDRFIPDKAKQAEFQNQLALAAMAQAGEEFRGNLQLALGQIEVNKTEAAAPGIFKGGWRPMVGWICAAALAEHFIVWGYWAWIAAMNHWPTPPKMEVADLMQLLVALLGVGTLRSFDKMKGTA